MATAGNFILLFVSTLGLTTLLAGQPKFYIGGGTEIDLGDIPNYAPVKRTLTIRNTGADTLVLSDIGTSCGCTATLLSNDRIVPEDSGNLYVTFDPRRFSGNVRKKISMNSNDPAHAHVEIYISANIVKVLELKPEYIYIRSPEDSATDHTLSIKNISDRAIKILSITTGADFISFKNSIKEIGPGTSATLNLSAAPGSAGTFNGSIDIATDNPLAPLLTVRYFALIRESPDRVRNR